MAKHDYMAGLIDGEGTITLSRPSCGAPYRLPIVSVSSTTEEILSFCVDNYGGHISTQKTYKEHHKQAWVWKISNRKAVAFCELIHPLLLEPSKRNRALHIATHYLNVTPRNGKYSKELREAKLHFEQQFFLL